MFDISWTEMLVVAVVMIIVVKPKDLPGLLRTIGKMVGNARRMVGDFQRQFHNALQEAELDEIKNNLPETQSLSDSFKDFGNDIRKEIKQSSDGLMNALGPETSTDMSIEDGKLADGSAAVDVRRKRSVVKKEVESKSSNSASAVKSLRKKTGQKGEVRKKSGVKKPAAKRKTTTDSHPA